MRYRRSFAGLVVALCLTSPVLSQEVVDPWSAEYAPERRELSDPQVQAVWEDMIEYATMPGMREPEVYWTPAGEISVTVFRGSVCGINTCPARVLWGDQVIDTIDVCDDVSQHLQRGLDYIACGERFYIGPE